MITTLLLIFGIGFLIANLRIALDLIRFVRLRSSAVLTWPGRQPPFYGLLLAIGVTLGILLFFKVLVLERPPSHTFGVAMMFVYYGYLVPLSVRIARGFYRDGIWAEGGFVPYSEIGALSWREQPELTLVLSYRMRQMARRLVVPRTCYAAARRVLRDKIAAREIAITDRTLDLGVRDDRDDV